MPCPQGAQCLLLAPPLFFGPRTPQAHRSGLAFRKEARGENPVNPPPQPALSPSSALDPHSEGHLSALRFCSPRMHQWAQSLPPACRFHPSFCNHGCHGQGGQAGGREDGWVGAEGREGSGRKRGEEKEAREASWERVAEDGGEKVLGGEKEET